MVWADNMLRRFLRSCVFALTLLVVEGCAAEASVQPADRYLAVSNVVREGEKKINRLRADCVRQQGLKYLEPPVAPTFKYDFSLAQSMLNSTDSTLMTFIRFLRTEPMPEGYSSALDGIIRVDGETFNNGCSKWASDHYSLASPKFVEAQRLLVAVSEATSAEKAKLLGLNRTWKSCLSSTSSAFADKHGILGPGDMRTQEYVETMSAIQGIQTPEEARVILTKEAAATKPRLLDTDKCAKLSFYFKNFEDVQAQTIANVIAQDDVDRLR